MVPSALLDLSALASGRVGKNSSGGIPELMIFISFASSCIFLAKGFVQTEILLAYR